MSTDFLQYLILLFIGLLFADKYVPAIFERLGIKIKKNGNGVDIKNLAENIAEILRTNHFHKVIENSDKTILLLEQIRDEVRDHSKNETPILQELSKGIAVIQAKQNG